VFSTGAHFDGPGIGRQMNTIKTIQATQD